MRVLLALMVAFALIPAGTPARAATATPSPPPGYVQIPPQPNTAQMGYYMMQGSRIVSAAYPNAPACFKAVAALMKTLPANVAPIVCAHRVP